jgi:hypothetical protein
VSPARGNCKLKTDIVKLGDTGALHFKNILILKAAKPLLGIYHRGLLGPGVKIYFLKRQSLGLTGPSKKLIYHFRDNFTVRGTGLKIKGALPQKIINSYLYPGGLWPPGYISPGAFGPGNL